MTIRAPQRYNKPMPRTTPAAKNAAANPAPDEKVLIPALQHALVLHRYFCKQLGAEGFASLQNKLHDVSSGTSDDGLTHWYHVLCAVNGLTLHGGAATLADYDRRITGYVEKLNLHRASPRIVLTYYQWLALVFTEMFLDRLYHDENGLLHDLNAAIDDLNAGRGYADLQPAYTGRGGWKYPAYAGLSDLRKAAFWMATGSGKTLLMHIHLWQWQFYAKPDAQNGGILLITPSEGLSRQHIAEFRKSGIAAARYEDASAGGLLASATDTPPVIVTEITKLTEKKTGSGQSVAVAEFEAFGLILVDEAHRGASSEAEKWRKLRGAVGKNALTLEYSATFGQTVNGAVKSKKPALLAEYAAAILFDFSYPYFYHDGYGKDYAILNTDEDAGESSDWVLLTNLLSFYEQCLAYAADPDALRPYNIERPLWIMVGNSVTSGKISDDEKASLSDVQAVVGFLQRFLSDRPGMTERIGKLLAGEHPLQSGDGRDLVALRLGYLRRLGATGELWARIVQTVFGASGNETLSVVELKTAKGELGLRVGAGNPYFGVINIGDVSGLKARFKEQGVDVEEDAVGAGLFNHLSRPQSTVNILIGSRKFMEGWDSFRVASMSLLHIGQGEGSQIIQLFGRGVRLRGKNYSLKRSGYLQGDVPPANLHVLETLNVFGIRASYMAQFRKTLHDEGIATDTEEIQIPIRLDNAFLQNNLQVLQRRGVFSEPVPLEVEDSLKVSINLRPRVEAALGRENDFTAEDAAGDEQIQILRGRSCLLDWNRITQACMNFRRDNTSKGFFNVTFDTGTLQTVFAQADFSIQSTPTHFISSKFAGLSRMEDTVIAALCKYIALYHERKRKAWETKNVTLEPLTQSSGNLSFGSYRVKISTDNKAVAEKIAALVGANALYGRELTIADGLPTAFISQHLYQPLLQDWSELANCKPTALQESEVVFIADLRKYLKQDPDVLKARKVFLLRNQVTCGTVFYDETGTGFYPDFLLWIVDEDGAQTLCFVDPHGIGRESLASEKIGLWRRLRDEIMPRLIQTDMKIRLNAFILAPTHPKDKTVPMIADNAPEVLEANHILFQNSAPNTPSETYVKKLFELLTLEERDGEWRNSTTGATEKV